MKKKVALPYFRFVRKVKRYIEMYFIVIFGHVYMIRIHQIKVSILLMINSSPGLQFEFLTIKIGFKYKSKHSFKLRTENFIVNCHKNK